MTTVHPRLNYYDQVDMERFQRLMAAHERLQSQPGKHPSTPLMCVDILEEMHAMIHQRRVPLHADRGYCGHGLLLLYMQLELWDRHLDWLNMRRDLEESADRKLVYTSNMLRLTERHPALVTMLPRYILDFDLEPEASSYDRARLFQMKSSASYQMWRANRSGEHLDQAIRWAERACETDKTDWHRLALQQLLQVKTVMKPLMAKVSNKLFVSGLLDSVSEQDLRLLFEATGAKVVQIDLPKDPATGRPRGISFITLSTPEEAESARVSLDGSNLSGEKIDVHTFPAEALPHDE